MAKKYEKPALEVFSVGADVITASETMDSETESKDALTIDSW